MIDLHALRARMTAERGLVLTPQEGRELLTELEVSRKIVELPVDGACRLPVRAQCQMVAHLLRGLAAGVADESDADLTAVLVVQELASLARAQMRRSQAMTTEGAST